MRFVYIPFQELIHANIPQPHSTYSIRCCRVSASYTELCCFHDVSADWQFTEKLVALCTEEQVEPLHFLDVFYDLSP